MKWMRYVPLVGEMIVQLIQKIRRKNPVKKPPADLRIWAAQKKSRQDVLNKFYGLEGKDDH